MNKKIGLIGQLKCLLLMDTFVLCSIFFTFTKDLGLIQFRYKFEEYNNKNLEAQANLCKVR
jgi:hypothetical protein